MPVPPAVLLTLPLLPVLAVCNRLGSTFNVTVDGHPALNLTSSDFLGLGNDPVVQVWAAAWRCVCYPHAVLQSQQWSTCQNDEL